MKIVIALDIHGSYYFASKLMDCIKKCDAEQVILLGDLYYHGVRNELPKDYAPLKVAKLINEITNKLVVVKGNCDSEVDKLVSDFEFCDMLKLFVNNKIVTCTHGDKYNKDNMPKGTQDVLIYGHYHTGFICKVDGVLVVNCGSVSLPKDGTANSFVFINDKNISLMDLDMNIIMSEKF